MSAALSRSVPRMRRILGGIAVAMHARGQSHLLPSGIDTTEIEHSLSDWIAKRSEDPLIWEIDAISACLEQLEVYSANPHGRLAESEDRPGFESRDPLDALDEEVSRCLAALEEENSIPTLPVDLRAKAERYEAVGRFAEALVASGEMASLSPSKLSGPLRVFGTLEAARKIGQWRLELHRNSSVRELKLIRESTRRIRLMLSRVQE